MSSVQNTVDLKAPSTFPKVLWLIAGSAVFWALEAWLVFSISPGLDTFPRLLVFSECVGMAITLCAVLLHHTRWLSTTDSVARWMVIGTISVPAGYVAGHVIAFLIFGEPIRFISHGDGHLIPIIFTVLGAGFGLHYFASREQVAKVAAGRAEAQRLATEAELRLLRAQLEPHMLFNTLANLRSLVRDDSEQAERMIDQLIVYLRSALAATRTETAALIGEFAQLRAYLDIMSLRMGPRLSYTLELPAELEQVAVPPMLLQPLVENAIKHGVEPKVGVGRIDVVARRIDSGVEISVSDTGLGLPPESASSHSVGGATGSYGLNHVRDRLKAVYGPKASLTLTRNEPAGACATVRIPA